MGLSLFGERLRLSKGLTRRVGTERIGLPKNFGEGRPGDIRQACARNPAKRIYRRRRGHGAPHCDRRASRRRNTGSRCALVSGPARYVAATKERRTQSRSLSAHGGRFGCASAKGMHRGRFVSYYRVSTDKQGKSGLGLEAQRKAVHDYLNGGTWSLVGEFTEIESGKPQRAPRAGEGVGWLQAKQGQAGDRQARPAVSQ